MALSANSIWLRQHERRIKIYRQSRPCMFCKVPQTNGMYPACKATNCRTWWNVSASIEIFCDGVYAKRNSEHVHRVIVLSSGSFIYG